MAAAAMSDPIGQQEAWSFADAWYRALDEHVPSGEIVPMVSDAGLEFHLPEGILRGRDEFREWYEGVIRIFFDEVHTLVRVTVEGGTEPVDVTVVVNWQARRWSPPAPRSVWIGFDAFQSWKLARDPSTGQPVITQYIVDELRPMPGSPPSSLARETVRGRLMLINR